MDCTHIARSQYNGATFRNDASIQIDSLLDWIASPSLSNPSDLPVQHAEPICYSTIPIQHNHNRQSLPADTTRTQISAEASHHRVSRYAIVEDRYPCQSQATPRNSAQGQRPASALVRTTIQYAVGRPYQLDRRHRHEAPSQRGSSLPAGDSQTSPSPGDSGAFSKMSCPATSRIAKPEDERYLPLRSVGATMASVRDIHGDISTNKPNLRRPIYYGHVSQRARTAILPDRWLQSDRLSRQTHSRSCDSIDPENRLGAGHMHNSS